MTALQRGLAALVVGLLAVALGLYQVLHLHLLGLLPLGLGCFAAGVGITRLIRTGTK
jgi:hypothetical protein